MSSLESLVGVNLSSFDDHFIRLLTLITNRLIVAGPVEKCWDDAD